MKQKKIIINADDCGKSQYVNSCIEEAIMLGKISSTTIMANMDDFDGAVKLYRNYHDLISFGWHINLDEVHPLTDSQILLDEGFFIEKDGMLLLNGMSFRKKYLNKEMRFAIEKELRCQWEKIRDNGINITHADSHHFIHSQPNMTSIMPSLFHALNITRCRHVANYGITGLSAMARSVWAAYYKMRGLQMTDIFCAFIDYYNNQNLKHGNTIELMCHPGHQSMLYKKEYELIKTTDVSNWGAKLITYKDI